MVAFAPTEGPMDPDKRDPETRELVSRVIARAGESLPQTVTSAPREPPRRLEEDESRIDESLADDRVFAASSRPEQRAIVVDGLIDDDAGSPA